MEDKREEDKRMKLKKFLYLFGILLIGIFFSLPAERSESLGRVQANPNSKPPIITHSFAVEKGYYGYIWKIYIEADDLEGDMLKIASVVHQPGWGNYPTDWIILKPQYRNHLRGYIQWNTFSSRTSRLREWTPITVKVSIFDKAGNESNEVIFPFMFESGVKTEYKLPAPFDQGEMPRLGYVHTDLFDPFTDRRGFRDD
jgi:hypothetical protein